MAAPDKLPGIDEAAAILERAVTTNARIVFIGDFDADGATSTALGVLALTAMGAEHVGYLVPNRFEFGYGLSPEIVQVAARDRPDLLITVDNGIANVAGVDAARDLGIEVIITDHHLPGERLPDAAAIVNPNLPDSGFPSSALAGVGVIFYVMAALRSRLRTAGWFDARREPNLADLLDLVAVGTIADLVPLDGNNRILVANGLERINSGRCRPGILALLAYGRAREGEVGAADIGYVLAPRLNAAGRLTDMSLGIECLLAPTETRARETAHRLNELNLQRRQLEHDMKLEALQVVEGMQLTGSVPAGICMYEQGWHQGIVGLIASRIRERVNRPAVAFADAGNGELKGSARSVEGLHIRDVLHAVDTHHPGLIVRFGGHAAAAGLSVKLADYENFRAAFIAQVARERQGVAEDDCIYSDGALDERDISVELAQLLKVSGPWGQGFPEPMFDDVFEVLDHRVVGEAHLKLKVRIRGRARVFDAIAFNQGYLAERLQDEATARLVYRLDINDYRGARTLQLVIEHLAFEPAGQDRRKAAGGGG